MSLSSQVSALATAVGLALKSVKATAQAAYVKPSGGVPKTDMATAVQTTLTNADSAFGVIDSGRLGKFAVNINQQDLNYIFDNGFYSGYGLTNAPTNGYFFVTVINHNVSNWCYQRVTEFANNDASVATSKRTWERMQQSGSWGPWVQIADSTGAYDATARTTANAAIPASALATNGSVLGRSSGGSYVNLAYGNAVIGLGLPLRDANGNILVPATPTQTGHAASKSYVDATISAQQPYNTLVMDTSTTTATINAFLAVGGYRSLRGTAVLTDSLIVPSGTTVDAYGADISGSVTKNILQNSAAVPARTVTTGSSTSGSTTLTASGAAFTSADVGRQVEMLAAGPNSGRAAAPGSWYGTIVSVTNSTTVVLSQPANLTTSGSTVYIYGPRNSNITIQGGVWRPGNKNSVSQQQEGHGFRIRRVDNITITDVLFVGPGVPQMGGQYAISLGDVTRSTSTNLSFQDVNSDGIHYQGPANAIVIQNVEAMNSGDDLVAFTPVDGQSQNGSRLGDTEGDIYDVVVQNVTGYGVLSHLKIAGGTGPGGVLRKLTKFNCDGMFGVTKGNAPINIVDYAGTTTFSGRIANVHAVGATNTAAVLTSTASNVLNLTVEDIHWPAGQGVPSTGVVNIGGVLHRKVVVRNVHYAATSGAASDLCPAVYVSCTNVDYLEVDGTFATDPNTPNFIGVQIAAAVVCQRMIVSRHHSGTGSSGNASYFTGSNWDIQHIVFREIHRYTGSWIDGTGTSTNTTNIEATNCTGGSAWVLLRQPANINIASCSQSTDRASGAAIRLIGTTAAANITVSASQRGGVLTSLDGTQSCRILECTCITVTDSTVTAAGNGDIYRNTTSLRLRSSGAWKTL